MEKITVDTVYNLRNSKGDKLQLKLGVVSDAQRKYAYRWSFIGTNIPMPVRSRTWFNGFPADTMLLWLSNNGWYLQTKVDMWSGNAIVYDLPKGNH